MKKSKVLFLIPLIGLFVTGCDFKETLSNFKHWVSENIYQPVKDFIDGKTGEEEQKPDEGGEQGGEQGGDQGGGGQGGEGGGEIDTRPDYEKGDKKAEDGSGLMFFETVGYNTKDATVFEEDENNRYIIYASNETAKGKQVFAARKATKENDVWTYGEKHIVLRGAEGDDAWDKAIYQPSVIKGLFNYNATEYHYLMAYQGNDGTQFNNHIGLAVSNDVLGEWTRVGEDPLLENPELYEASFGFGSPELISYNQAGLAYLFYSFGETFLSGTRVKTADFSDLNNINLEAGYAELPVAGLIGRDDNITSNAGFAIDQNNKLYIANDGMPDSNAPGCATSFEVAKADLEIIQEYDKSWTSIQTLGSLDTMEGDKLGWDELYSPAFVRDAYGHINTESGKLEVVYSTYDTDIGDAAYTGQLALQAFVLA